MSRRHRRQRLVTLVVCATLPLAAPLAEASEGLPAHVVQTPPGVGRTQVLQGFAVTLRSVTRAHEAGSADYVAARGHLFLFVTVEIRRAGSHDSYYADPQDFHLQTSSGDVIDSEPFGVTRELKARHIYRQPDSGVIGFEAPAKDRVLRLLWQPAFSSNPDAQAEWAIGASGTTVQYYH